MGQAMRSSAASSALTYGTASPHSTSADGVYIESSACICICHHPVLMVYRVACLCLHVITQCGRFTGWLVCAWICHHTVWMVYRVACLSLNLSSPTVDGLQGGVSVLAPVITHCGWFTGWCVCACMSSPTVDGLQGGVSVFASVITQC